MADQSENGISRRGGAGRSRRRGVRLVELKARVRPDAYAQADITSAALGVTMAEYVEALLLQDAQHRGADGRPTWWARPAPRDQEELPLSESA